MGAGDENSQVSNHNLVFLLTVFHLGATQNPCNRWRVPAIESLQYKRCSRCSFHQRNDKFSEAVFQELGADKKIHIFYCLSVGKWAVCPRQSCGTSEVLEKSLILQYFWDLVSRLLEISCKVFQNPANRLFRTHDMAHAVQGSQTDWLLAHFVQPTPGCG